MRILGNGKRSGTWGLFERRFVLPDYDNPKEASRIRWRLLYTPYFGIYLHKWLKPDPRLTPHNHPWSFFSIILKGEYTERRVNGDYFFVEQEFGAGSCNVVRRSDFHAVSNVVEPTWSLMFVGRDHGGWGYLCDSKYGPYYISHQQHPHNDEFKRAMVEAAA